MDTSTREADAAIDPIGLVDGLVPTPSMATSRDPLGWPGYRSVLVRTGARCGHDESVLVGRAVAAGHPVVLIRFEFGFLGGSMGEAAGSRIVAALDEARRHGLPVVSSIATGGARVQEGMRSLVQMQRIAAALSACRAQGIPHVAVLRDPTTGGVWASLAASADIVLAVAGARVSFAGTRVRGGGAERAAAFTAEGKLEHGFVDAVVDAAEAHDLVGRWVALLAGDRSHQVQPCEPPSALGQGPSADGAWDSVQAARAAGRPSSRDYLDAYFSNRLTLSGDRCGGVDPGMVCGIGVRRGRSVMYVAQTGTANTAAGFRTATRALRLAGRLRLPVLTLIDTPGAANDDRAEDEGIGTAIAETFLTVAALDVPITSVLVGEGGSGGALALAAPGELWVTPDSYFSVIAPEAAAAILHRDPARAREVASLLALRPVDLVDLGIARGVLGLVH